MVGTATRVGAVLLVAGLTVAGCGSGSPKSASRPSSSAPPSATAPTATAPTATAPTATGSVGAVAAPPAGTGGGTLCGTARTAERNVASLETTYLHAFQERSFAGMKPYLLAFLDTVQQTLTKATGEMSSAPANVRSALALLDRYFVQVISAMQGATSIDQMRQALVSIPETTQEKAAAQTLVRYWAGICGAEPGATP